MRLVNQLLIFAANMPGVLANICGSLNDEKINILAFSVVDHIDHSMLRMVVDDATKAMHLLGEAGLPVIEDQVLSIPLPRGPGALEKVASTLSESGINIHYAYASEPYEGTNSTLILKSNDDLQALEILKAKLSRSL